MAIKGYQRGLAPPERSIDHVFGPNAYQVRGGLRAGGWNASAPLAKLCLDDRWCCISVPGPFIRTAWIDRNETWQVRAVGRSWLTSGVMFDTAPNAFAGVIFWKLDRTELMQALVRHGWPVEPPKQPADQQS